MFFFSRTGLRTTRKGQRRPHKVMKNRKLGNGKSEMGRDGEFMPVEGAPSNKTVKLRRTGFPSVVHALLSLAKKSRTSKENGFRVKDIRRTTKEEKMEERSKKK